MPTTDPSIEIHGLHKRFGRTEALAGLDLTVEPGQIHGFLGPNGSGKSTTIRILLGLMRATSGTVRMWGRDPWHDAVTLHRRLAYVPGEVTLWPNLSGGQCLDVLARARGGIDDARRDALIDAFRLDPTKRTRDYSKGNRQKISLIAALAADVELLILDEPTSGLDPLMERTFQACVRERRDAGCTVLLSSHILAEVEALADRVSIIKDGRTIRSGTLGDLRRHARSSITATTRAAPTGLHALAGVADLADTTPPGDTRHTVRLTVDAEGLDVALAALQGAGLDALTVTPPSLDDLFLSTYTADGSA